MILVTDEAAQNLSGKFAELPQFFTVQHRKRGGEAILTRGKDVDPSLLTGKSKRQRHGAPVVLRGNPRRQSCGNEPVGKPYRTRVR